MNDIGICLMIEGRLDQHQLYLVKKEINSARKFIASEEYSKACEEFKHAFVKLEVEQEFEAAEFIKALYYYFKYIVYMKKI